MARLRGLLGGEGVTVEAWADVEEILIAGDVGAGLAMRVVEGARARTQRDAGLGAEAAVRAELESLLAGTGRPSAGASQPVARPRVILVVGVNGTGKTTT